MGLHGNISGPDASDGLPARFLSKKTVRSEGGIVKILFRDSVPGHKGGIADLAGREAGYQSEPFFRTQVIPELSPKQKSH
jgi:hypothetical protein